jgi:hypothetical protein
MLVHAAGYSSPIGGVPEETHAVVLTARGEAALRAVAARLTLAQAAFVEVREPDAPWCGALMAIGLVPKQKEDLRRLVSSLPLLK